MNKDGIPLPSALSGVIVERLIRLDKSLIFLVTGALTELADNWWLEQTGTLTEDQAKNALSDMLWIFMKGYGVTPIGTVQMFADASPPIYWLPCDGRAVGRTAYAELFAVIGTQYGVGNGTTTFNVPNLTDRIPMGFGGAVLPAINQQAGALTHTLTTAELAAHNHGVTDPGHIHTASEPGHNHQQHIGNNVVMHNATVGSNNSLTPAGTPTGSVADMVTGTTTIAITVATHTTGVTTNNNGSGTPHSILNPVIAMPFNIYAGV